MSSSVSKKGGKKIGRGLRKPAHARYVSESRRETNKIKKVKKHLKENKNDCVALQCLNGLTRRVNDERN